MHAIFYLASVPVEGMRSWSIDLVYKWLIETCQMGEPIAAKFKENAFDGGHLYTLNTEEMESFMRENEFDCLFGNIILKKRDLFKEEELKRCQMSSQDASGDGETFREKFRDFDSVVTLKDKYREGAVFPDYEARPGNLLQPVRRYIHYQNFDPKGKEMAQLAKETVVFANACLNGRTNGCIYFGVQDGKIMGIPLRCDPSVIEKELSKHLRKSFRDHQISTVMQCIRPIKFTRVIKSASEDKKYVLEVDVCPENALCKNDAFFCKPPQGNLAIFELTEDGPKEMESQALNEFIQHSKDNLSEKRKISEKFARDRFSKAIPEKGKKKLIHALCHGEDTLRDGDRYPFLVLSTPDEHMDEEYLEENMSFLSSIPWRAVFDTGSDGKIYQYMKSKGKLFRNRECEDLDPHTDCNVQAPEKVEELKEDIRSSPQASWIFTNGSEEIKSETMELKKWKQFRRRGLREFIDFYRQEFQTSRCIFVFVLLSRDYDISLEVADEISTTFNNQLLCIAETSQITEPWMDKLVEIHTVDKDALERRTVSGLDWHHVSAIVDEISEKDLTSKIQLTTKGGAPITLPDSKKNEWADLDILSATQCEGVIKDKKKLDAFRVEKEKHFYRGGSPQWWNYYFKTQVCARSQHKRLKRMVEENLEGKAFQADDGFGQVTLYHQPGAGGTTSAKHVLWDLKTDYRCAEVKHITGDTFDQITQFHNFKESTVEGAVPKPVLLLLDNPDEEKAKNLIKKIKEKARSTYSEGQQLFCVLLLVLRKKTATLLTEDDNFYTYNLALKHQLDQAEQTWFSTAYKDMEQRKENDPETLVAFNILKENFDKSYIERTVRGIVKEITDDKEVKLLKMLSLLNMYDVYKRPVPTSAFDHFMNPTTPPEGKKYSWGIMGSHLKPLWENHLSEAIRILLNVNSGYNPTMKLIPLCIFHPLMSEAILNILFFDKKRSMPRPN